MCLFQMGHCFKRVWYKRIWDDSLYPKDNFGKIHIIFTRINYSNKTCRLKTGPHKMASPESEIYWNYLKCCRWISLKSLSVFPISRILKSENLDLNWYTKIHVLLYCDLREWNLKRMWCLFDVTFDLIFQKPLKYNFSKIFHLNMACVYIIWEKYLPHIFVLTIKLEKIFKASRTNKASEYISSFPFQRK